MSRSATCELPIGARLQTYRLAAHERSVETKSGPKRGVLPYPDLIRGCPGVSCVAGGSGMKASQIEFPLRVAVCAWCEPQLPGGGVVVVSHGICRRHLRKMKLATAPRSPKNSARRRLVEEDTPGLPFRQSEAV